MSDGCHCDYARLPGGHWKCPTCGDETGRVLDIPPIRICGHAPAPVTLTPAPQYGPGTELKAMLDALAIMPTASCQCGAHVYWMNLWGVDGCREQRETIVTWLRKGYNSASVFTKLRAGSLAVAKGLPLTVEGLVDLAIERAESQAEPAALAS